MQKSEKAQPRQEKPARVALWQQLQHVAYLVQAVSQGSSATATLEAAPAALRAGVQALGYQVLRRLGMARWLLAQLAPRPPRPDVQALLCCALALAWKQSAGSTDHAAMALASDASQDPLGCELAPYSEPLLASYFAIHPGFQTLSLANGRVTLTLLIGDVLEQVRELGRPLPQVEVFAYGHLPLAYSARCFTARHHNLRKDECGFRCMEDPDGLLLKTREGEDFLVLNGIQTQSARTYNLIHALPALQQMGVEVLRLSPQSVHMPEIIAIWRDAMQGAITPAEAASRMQPLLVAESCNGYWHGTAGMKYLQA